MMFGTKPSVSTYEYSVNAMCTCYSTLTAKPTPRGEKVGFLGIERKRKSYKVSISRRGR